MEQVIRFQGGSTWVVTDPEQTTPDWLQYQNLDSETIPNGVGLITALGSGEVDRLLRSPTELGRILVFSVYAAHSAA